MRKFKHKKTGYVVNEIKTPGTKTYNSIITGNVSPDIVEDSNDWEEIIEKPEYVKCTFASARHYTVNKIYKVNNLSNRVIDNHNDNSAHWDNSNNSQFEPSTKEAYDLQNKPQLPVGIWCKVTYNNKYNYYKSIGGDRGESIHSNGTQYCNKDVWFSNYTSVEILKDLTEIQPYLPDNHIDKIKPKVLFTTHDGVDIINTENIVYACFKDGLSHFDKKKKDIPYQLINVRVYTNNKCFLFSTKQACQDYIDSMNKSKLDYEILSFICISDTEKGKIQKVVNNQIEYVRNSFKSVEDTIRDWVITHKSWAIHSIKRLSDSEVFTIDDKMYYTTDESYSIFKTEGCPIHKFTIDNNKIYVNCHNASKETALFKNWRKFISKPIKQQSTSTEELITVQLTKSKYNLLMQLLEE